MPYQVCSTPGCGELLLSPQTKCKTCKTKQDKLRRPNGNPYNTRGHQYFRQQVLARDPYCVCPGDCGKHTHRCGAPATIADHYPTERIDLIAQGLNPDDPSAGRGLCKACHDTKTARTKPAGWNDTTL